MWITQDEKAFRMLDQLLDWRACPLEDIMSAFKRSKVFGCREYIKIYGAHVMKREILGKVWVYKNAAQVKRLQQDAKAIGPALAAIGTVAVRNHSAFQVRRIDGVTRGAVDRALRENQCYIIGSEEDWSGKSYIGCDAVFQVIKNKELMDEDREWMLKELMWVVREEGVNPGGFDSQQLWDTYSYIFDMRVTFGQFDLWIRILNANKDDKTIKDFLRVDYGNGF